MSQQCCNAVLRKKSSLQIVPCNITLSREGNENGEKTTIGLISEKTSLHVQHTFLVHFFAVVLHD